MHCKRFVLKVGTTDEHRQATAQSIHSQINQIGFLLLHRDSCYAAGF